MRRKPCGKGERPIDFLKCRVVIFFVYVGLLTALTAIQLRVEPGTISRGASKKCDLTSADSGFQLDLEIALSGFPAEVQPHELFQPCRRFVETSSDVIENVFTNARDNLSSFIFTCGVVSVRSRRKSSRTDTPVLAKLQQPKKMKTAGLPVTVLRVKNYPKRRRERRTSRRDSGGCRAAPL
jgi:hypothetical protein